MYRGRCTGRLLEIIRSICPSHVSEYVCFKGDGKTVTIGNEGHVFATYTWISNTDIPIFTFSDKYQCYQEMSQQRIKDFIDVWGYWDLNPSDRFVGTTGIYSKAYPGKLYRGDQIKPSALTDEERQERLKAMLRKELGTDGTT